MRFNTSRVIILLLPPAIGGCQSAGNGFPNLLTSQQTEQWTILCREFTGPHAREYCARFAATLRRTPHINPDKVRCEGVGDGTVSRLYYGRYTRKRHPKTGRLSTPPELNRDLSLIQSLGDRRQRSFFLGAHTVPVVSPYEGHPEWDLANASGSYTLEIAVFYPEGNFTESRKAAVRLVEELRAEGYEAFYYHGITQSSVTVGTFGPDAVVELPDGRRRHSTAVEQLRHSDPRFLHHYENGQVRTQIKNGRRIKPESQLVRIPGHRRN